MQTDETGSPSVITEGTSLCSASTSFGYLDSVYRQSQNRVVAEYTMPVTHEESMNNFACGQMENRVTIAHSDEFRSVQPGTSTRHFSLYPQMSSGEASDQQFIECILAPNASINTFPDERYGLTENQEKLTTSGSYACPFDYTKTGIASNSSGIAGSPFETMLQNYEGLPLETSARWDFCKFAPPPELVGRVVGRTGVPPVEPAGSCLPNEWAMTEHPDLSSNSPGSSRFSNELSLSLATSQPSVLLEQCSEMSSSDVTSHSLHNRSIASEHVSCSRKNLSLSFNSYKPLQLQPLLSGSRFVQAMQEILSEIASYALENIEGGINVSFSSSCIAGRGKTAIDFSDSFNGDPTYLFQNKFLQEQDVEAKKKHLLSLLQLVDGRYNQCLDEIHTVTSAFHAVTELDPNLHARFALPTISFMYKNLRDRISSHILAVGAHLNEGETREERSFETCFIDKQWALDQLSKREHQLWRPQRGLPERSVSVLRAWMFQNFLHPYPKDAEKHLLALKSGLTRNQVSNWFINARVRLWKPMIEEMCAEMSRRKARRQDEETEGNHRNQMCFGTRRFTMDSHG